MSSILKGDVYGASEAELKKSAREIASAYYATECVEVRLYDQEPTREDRSFAGEVQDRYFSANFEARVEHRVEARPYGPDRCQRCGAESWPHDPIPKPAEWSIR